MISSIATTNPICEFFSSLSGATEKFTLVLRDLVKRGELSSDTVSYTHLTLPTKA